MPEDNRPNQFGVESDDDWPMVPALIAVTVMVTLVLFIALATH